MKTILGALLIATAILGARLALAQTSEQPSGIYLVMLFTIKPKPTTEVPDPAEIKSSIEFTWPPKYGGVAECKAFIAGSTWWHAAGDVSAIGSCIERPSAGAG